MFTSLIEPVVISYTGTGDIETYQEIPVLVTVNETQAIAAWVDYGGDATDQHRILGCVVTVVDTAVEVSATVTILDGYELPFSNLPVASNGYMVMLASKASDANGVDDSVIASVGIVDGLPEVIELQDLWDFFSWTNGLYTETASHYDGLAYNTAMVSHAGEIIAQHGYRPGGYPNDWSWKLIKFQSETDGSLTFVSDMGTSPVEEFAQVYAALSTEGYSWFSSDFDEAIVQSDVGDTSFTYVRDETYYLDEYVKMDVQPSGAIDTDYRLNVSGLTVTGYTSWADQYPLLPVTGQVTSWEMFSNSQVWSVLHDPLGNPIFFGTSQVAPIFYQDAAVWETLTGDYTDLGSLSRLFEGNSITGVDGTGYFGYMTAEYCNGVYLIALQSGSGYAYDNESSAQPGGAMHLLALSPDLLPPPNLAGAFEAQDRAFWRHRP